MEDSKMEIEEKIDQLADKTAEMDQKIDFIIEKIDELSSWVDGAAYMWEKFGKNYDKNTFRGIKRCVAIQNSNIKKSKCSFHD